MQIVLICNSLQKMLHVTLFYSEYSTLINRNFNLSNLITNNLITMNLIR